MRIPVRTLAILGVLLTVVCLDGSPALAQLGAPPWAGSTLRGRYHYYNGPHVSFGRGRWGGGISNNGALVLNTLTTTAGAVAPQIIPMFLPAAGIGSGQTSPGPAGTVSNDVTESAAELESLDVNRRARDEKLIAMEQRSLDLLERLNIPDSAPLSTQGSSATRTPATTTDNDNQITPGRPPGGN